MRNELQRLIVEVSGHAASAGAQAQAYSTTLDQFGETLQPGADPQSLRTAVDSMIGSTRTMRDNAGKLQEQFQNSSQEVQSLRVELQRARSEALTDPLTGIANRRGFEQAVTELQAANEDQLDGLSLLALDIDHFKKCNDTYGHLFGDEVIRNVAQVIASNVKGRDIPARIGGEEFVVLLPETPVNGARVLAERIRVAVAAGRIKRSSSGEQVGNITISIGIAQYVAGESINAFMSRADTALYASKSGGRNRVSIFSEAVPVN